MKFLKTKNISKWSVSDNTYIQNSYGRITIDSNNSLRLPKGTTVQRPGYNPLMPDVISSIPNMNGAMRYNTTTNSIEGYVDNQWVVVRAPAASTIVKQTLGPGDYSTTVFGPLSQIPPQEESILVFVENVFQHSNTNYNILYNYLSSGNAYIQFTSAVPSDKEITIYFGFTN